MRLTCFHCLIDFFAGGTFALYSLICRHANVSLLPNRQVADEDLSTYKYEHPPETTNRSRIKIWLEKHKSLHVTLLIVVMLGTCMVIGDGVLTPAISGTCDHHFAFLYFCKDTLMILLTFSFCFQFFLQFQGLSCPCPSITMNVKLANS